MPLVTMKKLLEEGEKRNYGIGAFSVANMEMIIGAIKAAEEKQSPIIIQIAEVRLNHSPLSLIGPMMVEAAKRAKIPVAVHFDHGLTIEKIKEALEIGFTSVMIDGSKYSLEKNILLTKEVVELAKSYSATVEAELGVVGGSEDGKEDNQIKCTDINQAKKFVCETKVDALAIAIGNAHGVYKSYPKLNFEILKKIKDSIEIPLVLHGGSGISNEDFKKAINLGIKKINIATETFKSVKESVKEICDQEDYLDYFKIHEAEVIGAYKNIKNYIEIFGSENKNFLID